MTMISLSLRSFHHAGNGSDRWTDFRYRKEPNDVLGVRWALCIRSASSFFLALLSQIREQARFAFRGEDGECREELIAETAANCWVAFVRLAERGLIDAVYATPLAQYAIKQAHDGRRVDCTLNVCDVSSEYAQQAKRFTVEWPDRYDAEEGGWREVLIEDRRAGPADTAAARMDIADWLDSLSHYNACHNRFTCSSVTIAGPPPTKTCDSLPDPIQPGILIRRPTA